MEKLYREVKASERLPDVPGYYTVRDMDDPYSRLTQAEYEGEKISDESAVLLSQDIAKQIEENLTFPGQVKVVVIRETRAVEYTKK